MATRFLTAQALSCTITNLLGQIALAVMVAAVVVDVIARYLFNSPIRGVTEVTELALVFTVFLGLAYTQRARGHVRVLLLRSRLPPRASAATELFALCVALLFIFLVGWQGGIMAWNSVVIRESSPGGIAFPLYISRLAIPVGCFVMFVQLLVDAAQPLAEIFHPASRRSGLTDSGSL